MIYSTSSNTIIYGEQVDGSCPSSGQNQSRFADGTTTQKIKCMSTGDLSRPITGCAGQIAVTWLRSRDHYLTFTWLLYIGLLLTCTFSSAHELRTSCLSHGKWQSTRLLSRNYFINIHIAFMSSDCYEVCKVFHRYPLVSSRQPDLTGVALCIKQAWCTTFNMHGVLPANHSGLVLINFRLKYTTSRNPRSSSTPVFHLQVFHSSRLCHSL